MLTTTNHNNLKSLQKEIDEQLKNFQESLKKDLPFHVLKDIHKKIAELQKSINDLKNDGPAML